MTTNDITLVFVNHEPFSKNLSVLFCVNELREKGFNIIWLDISQLLYPGLSVADEIDVGYLTKVSDFTTLENLVKTFDSKRTLCFLEMFQNLDTFKIFELFDRYKLIRLRFERYGGSDLYKVTRRTIIDFIHMFTWKRAINHFKFIIETKKMARLKQKIGGDLYNYYINSSILSRCDIRVNHPDYDTFLAKDYTMSRIIKEKYAVFIDVSYGLHPDVVYFAKRKYKTDSNKIWRNKLNSFFDYVENKYGIEVIIASHPKTNYSLDAFNGRKIIKYETLNLVKYADMVLMDFSAAFSYSVIYDKKIGIISTCEFYKEYANCLRTLTTKMGLPLFMIDQDKYENFEPRKINNEIRKNYLYTYMTSKENENISSADILTKELPSLLS